MTQTKDNGERSLEIENPIENKHPIDVENIADEHKKIFQDLQGGVIKNYGRQYSLYIFIQFDKNKIEDVKEWIRDEIASSVTSTWKQLEDTKKYRDKKQDPNYSGELCKNFFLSRQGYLGLGFDPTNPNNEGAKVDDTLFKSGMKDDWENKYKLMNPPDDYWYNPPERWDFGGKDEDLVHALIIIAHDDRSELQTEAEAVINKWEKLEAGKIVVCEAGYVLKDENRQTIGPFGFADGISQPLFLKHDYERYKEAYDTNQWDPFASLKLVLVKDPFGESYSYGSYCVFQKLETNYELFEEKVGELAARLGSDRERAGALVFGRFKDGTPIALSERANQKGDRHSFNFADDPNGRKCPLHAHIRKVNPRHDDKDDARLIQDRRNNRIFRAGITYFDESEPSFSEGSGIFRQGLNKLNYSNEVNKNAKLLVDKVKNISGLLFVCFQASISSQFSTQQRKWADNRKFPREQPIPDSEIVNQPILLDPIIGHPLLKNMNIPDDLPEDQEWTKTWDKQEGCPYPFWGCVKNRGGEFFFAPSISFLKKLP